MPHNLISLTKWPTMPAPMDSSDDGEAWIWGDYVAVLQKKPRTCGVVLTEVMNRISKNKSNSQSHPSPMEYPYAMIVYYKKHRNPHGPSSQPILCVGIEQANYGALKSLLGDSSIDLRGLATEGKGPMIVGVFRSERRFNLGGFDEILNRDTARAKFFEVIYSELNPEGIATHIGDILAIHGHPQTG